MPTPEPAGPPVRPLADQSTLGLVTGLAEDVRDLATAHAEGLRAEVKDELAVLRHATWTGAVALAVLGVGGLLLALGVAHALAAFTPLPLWAAYAAVGAAFVGGGLIGLKVRRRRDLDLVPERGLQRAARDARFVARKAGDVVSSESS